MGMKEWRSRLRGFGRRRLLGLRDRIDTRVERLERKKTALTEPSAAEEEPSRPARRRPTRRRRPAPPPPPAEE